MKAYDYVSIDDFYKVMAYAYLLKFDAGREDAIKFDDITITFVNTKITDKLFMHLDKDRFYEKIVFGKGIYHFYKKGELPIQFLIQGELEESCKWLSALNFHMTEERLHSLIEDYKKQEKN